ncbi:Cytochrome c-552 [Actibacterium lipolyticum]|uniref:Cytochrome c-552 n=2 Tax=Actibacterium lipolyticum TaxID=1524263 RepID=A0A238JQE3_9RHOB|nr:Cytochrome c-552 [Actibacterium lipolyticum]
MKFKVLGSACALIVTANMAMATDATATEEAAAAEEVTFEITGDAAAGEKVFRKCKACHAVGPDAKPKAGPVLNGIVGRVAGSIEGFGYSDAMVAAGADEGVIWSPESLDAFLLKPKEFVEGTKMSFAGLRKEDDRVNLIAYLASFETE